MSTIRPAFLINESDTSALFAPAEMYRSERCGICEQGNDADTYWSSPVSRWGHPLCVKMITPAESGLIETIGRLFQDPRKRSAAHAAAIAAVKRICEPHTLSSYVQENGIEKITILFNTFGVEAAKRLAAQIQEKETHEDVRATKQLITHIGPIGEGLIEYISPSKL
jgi:hypothetical protein